MVPKIKNLFPCLKDKTSSKIRIKKYLSSKDLYWAEYFCDAMVNHKHFNELKKIFGDISINVLKNHYESIVIKINKEDDLDKISRFAFDLNYLHQKAMSITSDMISIKKYSCLQSEEVSEFEAAYDMIYFFLKQEDSPLLIEANRRYNNIFEKLIENRFDEDILTIYEKEKSYLYRYMNEYYNNLYNKFLAEKNYNYERNIESFQYDCNKRCLKVLYHGGMGRRKKF